MRVRVGMLCAVAAAVLIAPSSASSAVIYAVTDQTQPRLVTFDPAAPGTVLTSTNVTGLDAGEVIRGMDLRPATGNLHLLTTDSGGLARLRILDAGTGLASAPTTLAADPIDLSNPYAGLNVGNGVGIDFNPVGVPDRLRVVTTTTQNLRVNPANGLAITDDPLNGGAPQVVAAGFTNSFPGAGTTTLFDIDVSNNALRIQAPTNSGTLTTVGAGLGVVPDTPQNLGFDISPDGNAAFMIARVMSVYRLYTVNLAAGTATEVGTAGDGTPIRDFALVENIIRTNPDPIVTPEAAGTVSVTVERTAPHLSARVDYATVDGTAVTGADYEARSGTLIFADGETAKTITVPLLDDATTESTKTFTVALSNAAPNASGATATLAGPPQALVSITDDDPAPVTPPPGDAPPTETKVGRTLTLKYKRSKDAFIGKVQTDDPACLTGKVKVYDKRGKKVAKGAVDANGKYVAKEKDPKDGKYVAKIAETPLGTVTCLAATSKKTKVG